jgi:hypothetical protein
MTSSALTQILAQAHQQERLRLAARFRRAQLETHAARQDLAHDLVRPAADRPQPRVARSAL